ncbi:MAG TPA: GTP-binding protein, partial [Quisquiliibacterium sp.]|nr:GTP-binding protein [Quisquiliibacterium sp.]
QDDALSVVQVGGCACCSGALVLRVALTRLLRRKGWHHVLILAGATARPSAIAAMLRSAPFEGLVEIRELVAALDAKAAAAGLDASARLHETALEQVVASTKVLLAGRRMLSPPAALALEAAVRDAAAGRRVLECDHGDWPDWAAIGTPS